ncbi:MAG: hypothetical protein K5685_02705 [Bacteroidales bacterium]|nr:hypothetical protein [Bacteroidales bacterium]
MNNKEEIDILEKLKTKLLEVNPSIQHSDFGSSRFPKSEKAQQYYLRDKNKNFFETPNADTKLGVGVEALRSSAAMIFNLLGQKSLRINNIDFEPPKYEYKYPAIKSEKNTTHNAHLDAVLFSKDENYMYAIEAKLLEWINSPKNLSSAYLEREMYLEYNLCQDIFKNFFNRYIVQKTDSKRIYCHNKKRYDAIQMTIHILAIYNACCGKYTKLPKNITLYNVVWKFDCEDYHTEEKEAKEFIENANKTFRPLFKEKGHEFTVEYKTFQEFKEVIDLSNDCNREAYLKRYEI